MVPSFDNGDRGDPTGQIHVLCHDGEAFEKLSTPWDPVGHAVEGEIDTSHFGFLHAGHVDPDDLPEDEPVRSTVINRAPEYHLTDTPWGTQ